MSDILKMTDAVKNKYHFDEMMDFLDNYPDQQLAIDEQISEAGKQSSDISNQLDLYNTNLVNMAFEICEDRKLKKTGQNNADSRDAELKRLQAEDSGYSALLGLKAEHDGKIDELRRQSKFLELKYSAMKRKFQFVMTMIDRASEIDVFNFKRNNQ